MREYYVVDTHSQDDMKRIKWVDTAKALGLFLVLWGHILYGGSEVGGVINKIIYSFHMPMYFLLSGYVMKSDSLSFADYFKSKFMRILLPAFIFYSATLPLYFFFLDYSTTTTSSVIRRICYFDGQCAYNSPIWFFFCLFEVLLLTHLMKLTEANIKKLVLIILISCYLSYACYVLKSQFFVFGIFGLDKCILGLFFASFGILLKRLRYERLMNGLCYITLPIWIVCGIWINPKVSMYSSIFGNYFLFIISALTGSFFFLCLCKSIENCNIIRQYAKWTIFIVCSHYMLVTCFKWISSLLSIGGTYIFDITSALFVIIALFFYKPLCEYVDNNIPVLMGNKTLCKRLLKE